jgi:hypothetical protein
MKYLRPLLLLALAAAVSAPAMGSQERSQRPRPSASGSFYRLHFTFRVSEDGKDRTRQFVLMLEERAQGKVRALTKVPVRDNNTTTYVETGIKCDTQFQEIEGKVRIEVEVFYADPPAAAGPLPLAPAFINEWQSRVEATIVPNEVTTLSTYDDEGGLHFQLDVRAEKLR